jgi:hypothetical protein
LSRHSQTHLRRRLTDELAVLKPYPKYIREAAVACRGDRQGAARAHAFDKAQVEAALGKRGADEAGEVRAAFGPVDAGAAEDAPAFGRRKVEAKA